VVLRTKKILEWDSGHPDQPDAITKAIVRNVGKPRPIYLRPIWASFDDAASQSAVKIPAVIIHANDIRVFAARLAEAIASNDDRCPRKRLEARRRYIKPIQTAIEEALREGWSECANAFVRYCKGVNAAHRLRSKLPPGTVWDLEEALAYIVKVSAPRGKD
jgi:hypothetical protein